MLARPYVFWADTPWGKQVASYYETTCKEFLPNNYDPRVIWDKKDEDVLCEDYFIKYTERVCQPPCVGPQSGVVTDPSPPRISVTCDNQILGYCGWQPLQVSCDNQSLISCDDEIRFGCCPDKECEEIWWRI